MNFKEGWKRHPRDTGDAAFRQMIEKLDMEEIRPLMCAKSHCDPLICLDCAKISTCLPGQRAVVLADKATAAQEARNAQEEASDIKDERQGAEQAEAPKRPVLRTREQTREYAERAVASGDVREFLRKDGYTQKGISNVIWRWRKLFPELMEEVPGTRRKAAEEPETKPEADDEVSVQDFLAEFQMAPTFPVESEIKPVQEPAQETTTMPILADKLRSIREEKQAVKKTLDEAEVRYRWLLEQEDALEKVLSLFSA